jgi:hypothetical protein
MIRDGVYNDEEIQQNLELPHAIPFIDDTIHIKGIPTYEQTYNPTYSVWQEYCKVNKWVFDSKLDVQLAEQKTYKR